jgi:hypothetical protein
MILLRRKRSEGTEWTRSSCGGRTISILASRNVDEIAALGPLLAAKSVEVQFVGLKELFLEKVKEDHANS